MSLSLAVFMIATTVPTLAGTVTVSFVHPETYSDASLSDGYDLKGEAWTLDEIGRYLEGLGARYLRPQQILTLELLNVDLAGKFEWRSRSSYDVRVLRDVYPPRFTLHYTLAESGRTLIEGQETVVDPNYLANPGIYFHPSDPLRFEKAMLADWLRARFMVATAAAGVR
jgi:hypothetical protein